MTVAFETGPRNPPLSLPPQLFQGSELRFPCLCISALLTKPSPRPLHHTSKCVGAPQFSFIIQIQSHSFIDVLTPGQAE